MNFFVHNPKILSIVIFFCFYVIGIIIAAHRIIEIDTILSLLHKYLSSIPQNNFPYMTIDDLALRSPTYRQALLNVLEHYPVIQKYEFYYIAPMKYGQSDNENYTAAIEHYNYLLMKRNYIYHDLRAAFNPLITLKNIFSLPSTFLEWVGFSPKETTSKLFNIVSWLLAFFCGLYSDEIKNFSTLLFHHLFNT